VYAASGLDQPASFEKHVIAGSLFKRMQLTRDTSMKV
jgi:hypothetical protein